jgi:ArsR family transcriptional regulator
MESQATELTQKVSNRPLKAAGVITGEISGPRTCYALNPSALEPLAEFIDALTPPLARACCVPDQKDIS